MTVLSAVMGWAAPNLVRYDSRLLQSRLTPAHVHINVDLKCSVFLQISKKYTHWAAIALFFFFGARSLYDAITGEVRVRCWQVPHIRSCTT